MLRRLEFVCFVAFACLGGLAPALAQFKEAAPEGQKTGDTKVTRYRCGMIIKATGGPCEKLSGYAPVPTDWPEQEVTTVSEEISPGVKVKYEVVDAGVKLMSVEIAKLAANEEAKAIITIDVRRSAILPPDDTDIYVLPDMKKLPAEIRPYLSPSPKIESRDPKIRELAKTIGADKEKAWEQVEAIYDWVREKVKYENGPLKGALAALKDGTGDCEEITSLFIAICRAADIPARTVWVPGHCYPEFYLEDDKGKGHWFPCQSAGAREFGGINDTRPILQKGDNFRGPKGKQRYMAEYLTGKPAGPGGGKPQVSWVRDTVGN